MSSRHRPITRPVIGQLLNETNNRIDELERLLSIMGTGGGGVGSLGGTPPIPPPKIPCPNGNSDCPPGWICVDGICQQPCPNGNADCAFCGGTCVAGFCQCPDFSLSCPGGIDMDVSLSRISVPITINSLSNFAGNVSLSIQDLCTPQCFAPSGTIFFDHSVCAVPAGGTCSHNLIITNLGWGVGSKFTFQITATGPDGTVHSCIITLTITNTPTFVLEIACHEPGAACSCGGLAGVWETIAHSDWQGSGSCCNCTGAGSSGGCGTPGCFTLGVFDLRLRSLNGFAGTVHVVFPSSVAGCCANTAGDVALGAGQTLALGSMYNCFVFDTPGTTTLGVTNEETATATSGSISRSVVEITTWANIPNRCP